MNDALILQKRQNDPGKKVYQIGYTFSSGPNNHHFLQKYTNSFRSSVSSYPFDGYGCGLISEKPSSWNMRWHCRILIEIPYSLVSFLLKNGTPTVLVGIHAACSNRLVPALFLPVDSLGLVRIWLCKQNIVITWTTKESRYVCRALRR